MKGVADTILFTTIQNYFTVFLPSQKKYSQNTIRSYRNGMNMLLDFSKDKHKVCLSSVTFKMLNYATITEFLDSLETERDCSISTRNQRLNCIRAFFDYAAQMDPIVTIYKHDIDRIPIKKVEKTVVEYMTESALKTVLEQPDPRTSKGLRDRTMMLVLYDTGARIQELLDVHLFDLRLTNSPTVTLHGKGGKTRIVPIMEKTKEHIKNYLTIFHRSGLDSPAEYLFYVTRQGKHERMCEDNARRFIYSYGISAKQICPEVPDKVRPHMFRHSRAMHLYQNGMPLELVSQWLGHAQLETTLIYAYADTEKKRVAMEKATSTDSPLKKHLDPERYTIRDEETLKKLLGLA